MTAYNHIDDLLSLLSEEARLKIERAAIDKRLRAIQASTKVFYEEAFRNAPDAVTAITYQGIEVERRVWRTRPRSLRPWDTCAFLVEIGMDVFSDTPISKMRLDKHHGVQVRNGSVHTDGEIIPGLKMESLWTFSSHASEMTA